MKEIKLDYYWIWHESFWLLFKLTVVIDSSGNTILNNRLVIEYLIENQKEAVAV
jgi:hypothetical protein